MSASESETSAMMRSAISASIWIAWRVVSTAPTMLPSFSRSSALKSWAKVLPVSEVTSHI